MDAHADTHSTRSDTSQITLVESATMIHGHEPRNTAPNEDPVPHSFGLPSPDVHLGRATNSDDIEFHEEQNPVRPLKSYRMHPDIRTEGNAMACKLSCTPQSSSEQAISPVITEEVSPSEYAVISAGGALSLIGVNEVMAPTVISLQDSPLLDAWLVSSGVSPHGERGADPDDCFNPIQTLHPKLDQVQDVDLARTTDERKAREDVSYSCEEIPSSLPPSSSPPQLFSSSPYASSQSSGSDVGLSKTMPTVEIKYSAGSDAHRNPVALTAQDDSHLDSVNLHTVEVATSETGEYCSQRGTASFIKGGAELSRKRSTDHDGSSDPQSIKRLKMDPQPYLPPAPKRATLASQNHQFKKLVTPFRPPLKLPIVADRVAKTMDNRKAESATTAREIARDESDEKESPILSQQKALNTPKCVTQFKSPLVNKVPSADSRTIRLTPALQALERKLQLLKRAIKVKEQSEEETLVRLAGKWIEGGREVAYDVWDATKGACNFTAKTAFTRRPYGWENTFDRNTPWGWDTNPGDASEGPCDLDASSASCTTGRPAPEEDVDTGCNTLGTMLRQLGIDPEIFGWDDDKETFSD